MSIFYYDEHQECANYLSDIRVGFKHIEAPQGTVFDLENKQDKHLLFFMKGSARVRYNEFADQVFKAGELIFLPKSADCHGETLTDTSFIILVYDNPVKLCDKMWVDSLVKYSRGIKYEFKSLPIKDVLMQFLLIMKHYLDDGLSCRHLHELKQKELFLLFRAYYEKEDLAQLFFPMLGKSMDFRSMVMAHYMSVKTAEELAAICGYSVRRLNELFAEEFGISPYKWMQKQKSKHIMGRLALPNVPIKEIIEEFNFYSASHFHGYCLQHYGATPAQVRKKLSTENQ